MGRASRGWAAVRRMGRRAADGPRFARMGRRFARMGRRRFAADGSSFVRW